MRCLLPLTSQIFSYRILTWPLDKILSEVKLLEGEVKQLKDTLYRLCWYMRGSVSISEAFMLSREDIDIINEIIKENLESTKKSGMPLV